MLQCKISHTAVNARFSCIWDFCLNYFHCIFQLSWIKQVAAYTLCKLYTFILQFYVLRFFFHPILWKYFYSTLYIFNFANAVTVNESNKKCVMRKVKMPRHVQFYSYYIWRNFNSQEKNHKSSMNCDKCTAVLSIRHMTRHFCKLISNFVSFADITFVFVSLIFSYYLCLAFRVFFHSIGAQMHFWFG